MPESSAAHDPACGYPHEESRTDDGRGPPRPRPGVEGPLLRSALPEPVPAE